MVERCCLLLTATKTKKICDKAVDNYPHILEFVPDCFPIQKMCDKALSTYPSSMQFASECYKTQEMFGKAVDICPFVFDFLPD